MKWTLLQPSAAPPWTKSSRLLLSSLLPSRRETTCGKTSVCHLPLSPSPAALGEEVNVGMFFRPHWPWSWLRVASRTHRPTGWTSYNGLNTLPVSTNYTKYAMTSSLSMSILGWISLSTLFFTDLAVVQRLAPKLLIPKHNMCQGLKSLYWG